ncbi:hypothetical protein AB0B30_35495 [Streptomyces narbonensis]|uniref:Uncharacterized protein n=1 Tax=Streptomyces narbonensis TaxID=67333 RepID=A0ABV3CKB6_9ACTN
MRRDGPAVSGLGGLVRQDELRHRDRVRLLVLRQVRAEGGGASSGEEYFGAGRV